MPKEWLSPLPLVGLMRARQSRVLLSRWQKASTSLRGDWLWHRGHWQHLGMSRAVKVAVPALCYPLQRDPRGCTWNMVASAGPGQHCGHPGQLGWLEAGGSFCKREQQWVGGPCIPTRAVGRVTADPSPSLTGSRGTELGVVSGRRCLTECLRGTWRVRPLRSRGWLSQELRVALWDGPAEM